MWRLPGALRWMPLPTDGGDIYLWYFLKMLTKFSLKAFKIHMPHNPVILFLKCVSSWRSNLKKNIYAEHI